jgi:hypothetical protein
MMRTPHQKKSPVLIILFFILFLIIISTSCEMIARMPWVDKLSPYRSYGDYHYQFEIKWFRLQDYVKQNGGVDVIILGSSLANTGIDPDVMAKSFYNQTGINLRIFNFGVEGLTVAPNSVTAGLLEKRYHPQLLIYITEMRDYIAGNGQDYEISFLADPWFQYMLGNFNLYGWAVDHSSALQHYLPYRNWMRDDFLETLPLYLKRFRDTTASGYELDRHIGENVDAFPDPNNPEDGKYFAAYQNYQIDPVRLENLQTILALGDNGKTKILVVEMPVHPTFYVYVGGDDVHKQFQQTLATIIKDDGGLFLPAEDCGNIPLEGRSNRWHLNYQGAPIFSECLGQQLSNLVDQQSLDFSKQEMPGEK